MSVEVTDYTQEFFMLLQLDNIFKNNLYHFFLEDLYMLLIEDRKVVIVTEKKHKKVTNLDNLNLQM